MKDLLTRFFTLLLVPLATAHAAEDASGKPASVFVPPPVASQARWERQMLHYGVMHLKQMEKAIAAPKADATIGANFYDRVRLLYSMAEQQQLGQPRRSEAGARSKYVHQPRLCLAVSSGRLGAGSRARIHVSLARSMVSRTESKPPCWTDRSSSTKSIPGAFTS